MHGLGHLGQIDLMHLYPLADAFQKGDGQLSPKMFPEFFQTAKNRVTAIGAGIM